MSTKLQNSKLKKPSTEQEWVEWCREWDTADHSDKVTICQQYGINYGTGRHWRSGCSVPYSDTLITGAELDDILNGKYRVMLDFVSFDIETSNLKADFSIVLSAVIKPFGKSPLVYRADAYPYWKDNRANDAELVADIAGELAKHAIIITHYGTGFDIPYLRTKMTKYGLPPLPPAFAVDSYQIAKKNFQVGSRRLASLSSYFDLGEKSNVDGQLWVDAAYNGSKKAMDEIVEHNIQDCIILERLAAISFPYLKSIPKL